MIRIHRLGLLLVLSLAALPGDTAAAGFPWKASITDASTPALAAIDEAIHSGHEGALRAYPVEHLVWQEEDFKLTIESGTIYLEPKIEGRTVGAFFEGKAVFSFTPRLEGARGAIRTNLGHDTLTNVPVGSAYIFSLRTDSPLTALEASGATPKTADPRQKATYDDDKSALRQLGLELTTSCLNRDGPGKNTVYIVLPFEEIRGKHSPKARLLYRFNPMIEASIGLAVFGCDELTAWKPYKYRFFTLLSYAPPRHPAGGVADLLGVQVQMAPGAGWKPASENAVITFGALPGVAAVRFVLAPTLEIASIRDMEGGALPFLQWVHLKNVPDFDSSVLIMLDKVAPPGPPHVWKIEIVSSGLLFETLAHLFVLIDEDNWYPRFPANDESPFELTITLPKDLTGIGAGHKVSDTVEGLTRTTVYRTTKPTDRSTMYFGDFTMSEGEAAGIKVELYSDRLDIRELHNTRFVLGELTGALDFMSEQLRPLDIDVLRAVSTPTGHVRGFEGLILMGPVGSQTRYKAAADMARAAAVAYQWWGSYVKLKSWPRDRWLFEGLAAYTAMEYYRTRKHVSIDAREAIQKMWVEPLTFGSFERKNLAGQKEELEGSTVYPLLAGKRNVYSKGPMVLQMLRYLMTVKSGDEDAFFDTLRDFLTTYQYLPAGTEEFQQVAEKHMGESLDWFFRQWVADGGVPVLTWRHRIAQDGTGWKVTLSGTQEQRVYRLLAPVTLHYADGSEETKPWFLEGAQSTAVIEARERPESVTLNDDLELLAVIKAR